MTYVSYTIDDLRNKYVHVGTPEYEVFMNACEELGVTWEDKGEYGGIPFSGYVGLTHFDSLLWGKTSLTLITTGFHRFTPKQPQPTVAEETPWTIYNITLPMPDLTDEQAAELFVTWRKGGVVLKTLEDVAIETHPTWEHNSVYAIKRKSESAEFVEKMLTFYNNDVIDEKVIDMLK